MSIKSTSTAGDVKAKVALPSREKLSPNNPSWTMLSRYEDGTLAEPARDLEILAGRYLSTRDAPPDYPNSKGWQKYTHPEGKAYCAKGDAPRIITEMHVTTDATVAEVVDNWVTLIFDWAKELGFVLGKDVELFVELGLEDNCLYHFIDHGSQTVFWLQDHDASDLGLPVACSEAHLKLALEERYWNHVEMFCMHLSSGLPGTPLESLIGIYLHGRADLATSNASTFPYTPETAEIHLKILKQCQGLPHDPIIYSFVGRLWGTICDYRFNNFYGEDHSRLDRTTRIFEREKTPFILVRVISTVLLFGHAETIRRELNQQLVDNIVILKVWQDFISDRTMEWTKLTQWILALIITSAVATAASPIPLITHVSLVLSTVGLLLAILLPYRMQNYTKDVEDARAFLATQNGNLMSIAVVFAFPRAAFIWSLILLAAQAMVILFFSVPLPVGITVCVVVPLLALWVLWIVYPLQRIALYQKVSDKIFEIHIPYWHRSVKLPDAEAGADLVLY